MRSFLLLLCFAATLLPQTPAFLSESRVVLIPVSVVDGAGKNIEGLKANDFLVLDDGKPRTVALDIFGSGAAPISLVIAVQTSGLSNPALEKIRRIGGLIQPLVIGRRGEAAILTFDYTIEWRHDFVREGSIIQRALGSLEPGDYKQARLFDAVIEAAAKLKDRPGRRILLLISQPQDKGSKAKLDRALETVAREGVEIFAAPPSIAALGMPDDLESLALATGGSQYPFARQRSAEKAIEDFGAEVHSQYILSFPQGSAHPGMHRIGVSVPNHPNARLRTRNTWWSE